jgi:hypothetical protein
MEEGMAVAYLLNGSNVFCQTNAMVDVECAKVLDVP